jgi:hypothetical protein
MEAKEHLEIQKESRALYQYLVDCGQTVDYEFVCYKNGEKKTHRGDHRENDGLSFMVNLLGHEYNKFYPGLTPKPTVPKKPGPLQLFVILVKNSLQLPFKPAKWKIGNPEFNKKSIDFDDITAKSSRVLSFAETEKIRLKTKRNQVNLSSLITFTFANSIRPFQEKGRQYFMFPVSHWKKIDASTNYGNNVSYLDLILENNDDLKRTHQKIVSGLKQGLFWGNFTSIKLLRYLPSGLHSFILGIFFRLAKKTGSCVNLGDWDAEKRNNDLIITGYPPVYDHNPIAFSFCTWGGKLALGLSIHPILSDKKEFADDLLTGIVDDLLKD